MLNAQENECRAKEAESLEQAKQTNDKDLKHLHETIARQWRRLAERIETGPANTSVGCESPEVPPSAQDASISGAKTDAEQDVPRAARIETPLEWMLSCWFGGNLDGKSEKRGSHFSDR
jgi:hypothetical protein